MANTVIKRDVSKQPFDSEKIKNAIRAAALRTEVAEERLAEIVERVTSSVSQALTGVEEVATTEIRDKVLAELDSLEPSIAAAWRQYDQEQGKV